MEKRYSVLIFEWSSTDLMIEYSNWLRLCLEYNLFDNNECITKYYAVKFESIEENFMNNLAYVALEDYHELFAFILFYSPKIFCPIISH